MPDARDGLPLLAKRDDGYIISGIAKVTHPSRGVDARGIGNIEYLHDLVKAFAKLECRHKVHKLGKDCFLAIYALNPHFSLLNFTPNLLTFLLLQ